MSNFDNLTLIKMVFNIKKFLKNIIQGGLAMNKSKAITIVIILLLAALSSTSAQDRFKQLQLAITNYCQSDSTAKQRWQKNVSDNLLLLLVETPLFYRQITMQDTTLQPIYLSSDKIHILKQAQTIIKSSHRRRDQAAYFILQIYFDEIKIKYSPTKNL